MLRRDRGIPAIAVRQAGHEQFPRVHRAEQRPGRLAVRPGRAGGTRGDQRAHPQPRRTAVDRPGVQRPVRRQQVADAAGERQRGGFPGGAVGQAGGRGARRRPAAARGGSGVQREAGALGGVRVPAAGARRPQREHPAARRLQVRHPQAAGVDRRPGLTAGMGDPQLGPERPPVAGVEEPDPVHPGRAVRRAGQRRGHAGPGAARVVGARHRRAVLGGAVARAAGLADHPAGARAHEGDGGGPKVSRHRRRDRHGGTRRRGRPAAAAAPGRRGGGRLPLPGLRGRRGARAQHRQSDHLRNGHRRGHDDRRRGRGDGQLAVLAAPRPALDQLERARRRRERLDPPAQPGVDVVAAVSHHVPQAPSSAGPAPRTGPP